MSMTQTKKRKPSFSPEPQTEPSEQTQHPTPKHDSNIPSSSPAASNLPSPPLVYPPDHRFVPTDEEIISNYCQGNIKSKWPDLLVHEVNIYDSNPQKLSEEYEKGNLKEWFFISERIKVNKDYGLESSHDTKTTVDYAFYKIYLSPHAKSRKKKAEQEIDQTRHHDVIAYQTANARYGAADTRPRGSGSLGGLV